MTVLKLILKNLVLIENTLKQKSNEIKITEQQKDFDKIFELLSNNNLITRADTKGNIIYANEIFQKTSGFTEHEIIGQKHSIIRHEKTTDLELSGIWKKLTKKKI